MSPQVEPISQAEIESWLDGAERGAVRAEWVARIPAWYSPWGHIGFVSAVGLGLIVASVLLLKDVRMWELATVPLVWVLANAVEWRAHRSVLHKPWPPLKELFIRHTPQHHRLYVTDDMEMRSSREFRLVLIPFYGIVAIFVITAPVTAALVLAGLPNLACFWVATTMGYVLSYEWLHLAYHLPAHSFVGRLRLIRVLRRHHALHHHPSRMQKWNFNVTIPLWDWVRGTLYRSGGRHEDSGGRGVAAVGGRAGAR